MDRNKLAKIIYDSYSIHRIMNGDDTNASWEALSINERSEYVDWIVYLEKLYKEMFPIKEIGNIFIKDKTKNITDEEIINPFFINNAPQKLHEKWVLDKQKEGWNQGELDFLKKKHPYITSYEFLSVRRKTALKYFVISFLKLKNNF